MPSRSPAFLTTLAITGLLAVAALAPALLRAAAPAASTPAASGMPMMGNMASMPMTAPNITAAIVVLTPTQGNDVHGTIKFSKVAGGIRVVADVTGLKPGLHGFHVHDYGDITSNNADSAGGHFNPAHEIHGGPPAEHRNVGDLGNINADASGHATIDYVNEKLAFEGPASIIGRAVVIHADPDDYNAQPGGNAGAKIAYGVIGIAKGP